MMSNKYYDEGNDACLTPERQVSDVPAEAPAEAAAPVSGSVLPPSGDDGGAEVPLVKGRVIPPQESISTSRDSSSLHETELVFDFGVYRGEVDPLTGLRDGQGTLTYRSGNVYTGGWRQGAADGFGEKRYANGDVYRGNWKDGKRNGVGGYLHKEGHYYEGSYVGDLPTGYGVLSTVDGDRYAGGWLNGKKHGKGRETLHNGQVFTGKWREGNKQGRGKLFLPGAREYIYGIWNNNHFFRELTPEERRVPGAEDAVDEHGHPRDPTLAPADAPTHEDPEDFTEFLGVQLSRGVAAAEERLAALGRALERVMGGGEEGGGGGGGGPENPRVLQGVPQLSDDESEEFLAEPVYTGTVAQRAGQQLERAAHAAEEKVDTLVSGVVDRMDALDTYFNSDAKAQTDTATATAATEPTKAEQYAKAAEDLGAKAEQKVSETLESTAQKTQEAFTGLQQKVEAAAEAGGQWLEARVNGAEAAAPADADAVAHEAADTKTTE